MNLKIECHSVVLAPRVEADARADSRSCSRRSTRRALILAAVAWPALAWAGSVLAQSKQKPVLIGWLSLFSRDQDANLLTAFKEGLAALGWKEDSNVVFEERFADGRTDRLPALAGELAAKKPAVIVAAPPIGARPAAKAAPQTPIVVIGGDPVSLGLVASYARPGGMVTGISSLGTEISEKYLEILLAAAPKLRQVGFLFDLHSPSLVALHKENVRRSVAQYAVEARIAEVARPEEIEPALSRLAKEGVQALVVVTAPPLSGERQRIVNFALAQRWPVIGGSGLVAQGALLSYSVDSPAMYRRAAYYVDRILKGTKPADLPIERPTKFELVLNMKTARALKLDISRELAVRVDRVIE